MRADVTVGELDDNVTDDAGSRSWPSLLCSLGLEDAWTAAETETEEDANTGLVSITVLERSFRRLCTGESNSLCRDDDGNGVGDAAAAAEARIEGV
jgi:hypothetical protein